MWKFLKSGAGRRNSDIMFRWAANKVMCELLFVMNKYNLTARDFLENPEIGGRIMINWTL